MTARTIKTRMKWLVSAGIVVALVGGFLTPPAVARIT